MRTVASPSAQSVRNLSRSAHDPVQGRGLVQKRRDLISRLILQDPLHLLRILRCEFQMGELLRSELVAGESIVHGVRRCR